MYGLILLRLPLLLYTLIFYSLFKQDSTIPDILITLSPCKKTTTKACLDQPKAVIFWLVSCNSRHSLSFLPVSKLALS